jgi:hypothetical protein
MGFLRAALAKQTTATIGPGTLTLVANAGDTRSFQQAVGSGPVKVRVMLRGAGYYEHFRGTFTAPSTLTRDEVISSSSSDTLVNIPTSAVSDVYLLDYAQFVNDPFTGNKTLTNKDASNSWIFGGSTAANLTLVGISSALPDFWGFVDNVGTAPLTLVAAGSDTIQDGGATGASIVFYPGQSGHVFLDTAAGIWRIARDAFGVAANPNKIINGDMRIDQRNAGASVTPANASYTLDRWQSGQLVASKYSVQQNAGAVTPPAGFNNYLGVTSLSAYSVGASEYFNQAQRIEGLNCKDLGWGGANAKPITISFLAYSSITGTHGGSARNGAATRSYPFTYSVIQANTWEFKTVTIPGDTSGTWLTDNGVGLEIIWGLGVGTTLSGAAGTWASANYVSATGAVSIVGTNAAKWYVTGVKVEIDRVATSFQADDYGISLHKCRHYYQRYGGEQANETLGIAVIDSAVAANIVPAGFTPMRIAPAVSSVGAIFVYSTGSGFGVTGISGNYGSAKTGEFSAAVGGGGMTGGRVGLLLTNLISDRLEFNAEL